MKVIGKILMAIFAGLIGFLELQHFYEQFHSGRHKAAHRNGLAGSLIRQTFGNPGNALQVREMPMIEQMHAIARRKLLG